MGKLLDYPDGMALSPETFEVEIREKTFLKFYTKTCPPCKMLKTILEKIIPDIPDVFVISCDANENSDMVSTFKIRSVPKLIKLSSATNGVEFDGNLTESEIRSFVESN